MLVDGRNDYISVQMVRTSTADINVHDAGIKCHLPKDTLGISQNNWVN